MIFLLTKWAKFTFPHTPKGVGPKGGDAKIDEIQTLKHGTIPFGGNGTELQEVSWTSFFSHNAVSGEEARHQPFPSIKFLDGLKESGEVILLNIPELNYQKEMILKKFEYWIDSPLHIEYTITFKEHREIYLEGRGRPQSNYLDNYILKTYKVVHTKLLAVRRLSSSDSEIIGTLREGSIVTQVEEQIYSGWVYIQHGSLHGFVAEGYLERW